MTNLIESTLSVIINALLIVGSDDPITFAKHKTASMFRTSHLDQRIGQPVTRFFMADDQEILAPNLLRFARNTTEFEAKAMLLRFDGSRYRFTARTIYSRLLSPSTVPSSFRQSEPWRIPPVRHQVRKDNRFHFNLSPVTNHYPTASASKTKSEVSTLVIGPKYLPLSSTASTDFTAWA